MLHSWHFLWGKVMHIPDGFLSTQTWVPAWLLSAGGIAYCLDRAKKTMQDRIVPLMGVMAAFIFAAQMVNFPVMGGTSGHLLGGILAAVLLGPYAAAIVIACVLAVQCLLFQDGGLTALGANILNMAVIGTMGGYIIYKLLRGRSDRHFRILLGTAMASWASVMLASGACALELAFSGTSTFGIVVPAMLGIHAVIGIGEGIITTLIVGFLLKVRPDLFYQVSPDGGSEAPVERAATWDERGG
jgi:cobalt/nickel transport system permease protein